MLSLVYVIIVMYIHLFKKIYQLITQHLQILMQITLQKVLFKKCAPFTECISEINNTQVDNAEDIDT